MNAHLGWIGVAVALAVTGCGGGHVPETPPVDQEQHSNQSVTYEQPSDPPAQPEASADSLAPTAVAACDKWIQGYLFEPGTAPGIAGAKIEYIGIGDHRDPADAIPSRVRAKGKLEFEPAFVEASVVEKGFHCRGHVGLDWLDGAGKKWGREYIAVLDLVRDGKQVLAGRVTLVLVKAMGSTTGLKFERKISEQEPFVGNFTGTDDEQFHGLVSTLTHDEQPEGGWPDWYAPGESMKGETELWSVFHEGIILGTNGHLLRYELFFVQPLTMDDEHKARGWLGANEPVDVGWPVVKISALDLGLDRAAVALTWTESFNEKNTLPTKKEPCEENRKWTYVTVRVLEGESWNEIFHEVIGKDSQAVSNPVCVPGNLTSHPGFDADYEIAQTEGGVAEIHIVYPDWGDFPDRIDVFVWDGKKYVPED